MLIRIRRLAAAALVLALLTALSPQQAALAAPHVWQSVRLHDLGHGMEAREINNSGMVVGWVYTEAEFEGARAAVWSPDGRVRLLPTLGGGYSVGLGLNDRGVVVGESATAVGARHVFVWDFVRGMRDIGTLGGETSYAVAINESGDVAGSSTLAGQESGVTHAFLWTAQQGMHDLGTLGGPTSSATALNDAGVVVGYASAAVDPAVGGGYRAFRWTRTEGMEDLTGYEEFGAAAVAVNPAGSVAGWIGSHRSSSGFAWTRSGGLQTMQVATAIDAAGRVAGSTRVPSWEEGFERVLVWSRQFGTEDVGTLGGPESYFGDMNVSGHIVGSTSDATGAFKPFVWSRDGGMLALPVATGAQSAAGVAISDSNRVLGRVSDENRQQYWVAWS
jgi:probable HAF family extracellular repeat protein